MLNLVADFQQNKPLTLNPKFVHGVKSILCDSTLDKVLVAFVFLLWLSLSKETKNFAPANVKYFAIIQEFIAKAVTLPGEGEIMDMMDVADPDAVHAVRCFIKKQLASELKEEFLLTVYIFCGDNYIMKIKQATVYLLHFRFNLALHCFQQVKNNRSSEQYEFNHPNMARRALKNIALGLCYL